jgi:hypothetical protein
MRKVFFILILSLCFVYGFAQVQNYSFSQDFTTYTDITGGSVHQTGYHYDVHSYNNISLGFGFEFNGVVYSNVSLSSYGFLVMGNMVNEANTNLAIASTSNTNLIAGLNYILAGQDGSEIRTETIGESPNRIFVAQFKNYKVQASSSVNFQIRLSESSNSVEIVYGACEYTSSIAGKNVQVGLKGDDNTDFNIRKTPDTGVDRWVYTSAGTLNNDKCRIEITNDVQIVPPNGLTFTWTPISGSEVPLPAIVVFPSNETNDILINQNLQWLSGGGVVDGYYLNMGTNYPPTNLYNNQNLGISNELAFSLEYGTTYFWQIIPFNSNGNAENCPIWSFTTQELVELTYYQNFDDIQIPEELNLVDELPVGWRSYIGGTISEAEVVTNNFSSYNGLNSIRLKSSSQDHITGYENPIIMLISPPVEYLDQTRIAFHATYKDSYETVKIGVLSDPQDPSTFELIESIDLSPNYVRYTVSFDQYSGNARHVAFKHGNYLHTSNSKVYIDNFVWENIPSGASLAVNPTEVVFPEVNVLTASNPETIILENTGVNEPLIVTNIDIIGEGNASFALTQMPDFPYSIAPNMNVSFNSVFAPLISGTLTASIAISYTIGETTNLFEVPLSGTGIGVPNIISSFPYEPDFDVSDADFLSAALSGDAQWEWGVPNKVTYINEAHTGSKVWITKLNPELSNGHNPLYDHGSNSILTLPEFDMSSLSDPYLSLWLYIRTDRTSPDNETGFDAMVLECSFDHGVNWHKVEGEADFYNYNGENGSMESPKWAGQETSWINFESSLPQLAEQSSVQLRFRFMSDNNGFRDEGIAIDDFTIYDGGNVLETYNLTLESNPSTAGSVNDNTNANPYYENSIVNISAIANEGYIFTNWTNNDEVVSTNRTFNFSMPASHANLVANFAESRILNIDIEGSGTTRPGLGSHAYALGSVVDILATPEEVLNLING